MGEGEEKTPAVFVEYHKQLWDARKLSHEQYDKALLTLSAGGLAISLTLVKDLFPAEKVLCSAALVASWVLFCGSIILTIISFLTSQKSLSVQSDYFEKYAAGDDSYWNKKNPYTIATTWLNLVSGLFFVSAVVAVTVFSITNFKGRLHDGQGRTASGWVRGAADAAYHGDSTSRNKTIPSPGANSRQQAR